MKRTALILIFSYLAFFCANSQARGIDSLDLNYLPVIESSNDKVGRAALNEDCIDIDQTSVQVAEFRGRYKIVDGERKHHHILDFGKKRRIAYSALNVLRQFESNEVCFIGRPGPSMTYVLKDGKKPKEKIRGEKCKVFDPEYIHIIEKRGRFKLVGKENLLDFGTHEAEALKALQTIRHYQFTETCHVGRKTTTFIYLR